MKSSIVTIEQVSKEIKTKISKLGKDQLVKKFSKGKFSVEEEIVAAEFYILKRESLTQDEVTEIKNKFYSVENQVVEPIVEQPIETNDEQSTQKPEKKSSAKKKTSTTQEAQPKVKKEKQPEAPVIKLTEQEFVLFEKIKKNQDLAKLQKSYESLREFKGVLGSLAKKNIVEYSENILTILDLGQQMIDGTMPYKQKAKHEQNFFKKERLTIEIDGKLREKSAYVRLLLQKNNNISCAEINEKLAAVGFPKLYHSELQRCKEQLNIKTVKEVD